MHERACPSCCFAVVPAAVRSPHGLEFLDNAVDAIGHEAGEIQVAEGIEEVELLFAEARCRTWLFPPDCYLQIPLQTGLQRGLNPRLGLFEVGAAVRV